MNRNNLPIYCLILVIMVMVGRVQEVVPGLSALKLGKVSFLVALVLYAGTLGPGGARFTEYPQLKRLAALVVVGLVSTPFSMWVSRSVTFMVFELGSLILMILLLKTFVTTYPALMKVLWGVVLPVSLLGATALLFSTATRVAASGTYDPNDLAMVMVVFLPLVLSLMRYEKGMKRLLLMGISCLFLLTIMATQSRGGWLGLVVVSVLLLKNGRVRVSRLILPGLLVWGLAINFAPEGYWDRISTIFSPSEDYNLTASAGRVAIWKRGIAEAVSHPMLGVGPAVFAVAEGLSHEEEGGKWSPPHNSFIQVLAEFGIPGFIIYVAMIWSSLKAVRSFAAKEGDPKMAAVARGIEMGFYGFLVCGFFLSQAFSSSLFLLIGLSVVLPVCQKNAADPVEPAIA